jgi:hypothetical protein
MGKTYQTATKYQMAVKYTKGPKIYLRFPFQGAQKYTQIDIFGIKIFDLATLMQKSLI